jgi:hypothetical protein
MEEKVKSSRIFPKPTLQLVKLMNRNQFRQKFLIKMNYLNRPSRILAEKINSKREIVWTQMIEVGVEKMNFKLRN